MKQQRIPTPPKPDARLPEWVRRAQEKRLPVKVYR